MKGKSCKTFNIIASSKSVLTHHRNNFLRFEQILKSVTLIRNTRAP